MNCQRHKQTLLEISRGQSPVDADDALVHAASCQECAAFLDQQKNLTAAIEELRHAAVPGSNELPALLINEFRAQPLHSKRRWLIPSLRAAVLAGAMIAGWFWFESSGRQSSAPANSSNSQLAEEFPEPEFIPLYYGEPFSDSYHMVRVVLPASALQQFGLPFDPSLESETYEADLLLSENGLPQAIRFIRER